MLASATIEDIFDRMLARYGSAWRAKWQGVNLDAVKADWANELDGATFDAITYGLSYLPADFPPSVGQFRDLCSRVPAPKKPERVALPAPKRDPQRLKAELQRLHRLLKDRPPRQWAYDLQEREAGGEILTMQQRAAWRESLRQADDLPTGIFQRIAPEALPPGMRPDHVDPEDCADLEQRTHDMLHAYRAQQLERQAA